MSTPMNHDLIFMFKTPTSVRKCAQATFDQPLRNRRDCLEVKSLSPHTMVRRAYDIVTDELGTCDQGTVSQLLDTVDGSWRDALLAVEDLVLDRKEKSHVL